MIYLRINQHMSRLFREHFGRLHLTFPQALVLTVLEEEGALAQHTGSANSTVSGIVDRVLCKKAKNHLGDYFLSVLDTMTETDLKEVVTGPEKAGRHAAHLGRGQQLALRPLRAHHKL